MASRPSTKSRLVSGLFLFIFILIGWSNCGLCVMSPTQSSVVLIFLTITSTAIVFSSHSLLSFSSSGLSARGVVVGRRSSPSDPPRRPPSTSDASLSGILRQQGQPVSGLFDNISISILAVMELVFCFLFSFPSSSSFVINFDVKVG